MVLFIRDNECFEPRVRNYFHYFHEKGIEYHVIAWNRNGMAEENENITFFQRRAEYGKRIKNIPNKVFWMIFVMKEIFKNRKRCTAIHACDIDAILPALIVGKILRKKVIFDIFDWISSLTGKGFIYGIVEFLQNWAYKHSDYVILCEEERKAQARVENTSVYVLPNIPDGKTKFDEETLQKIEEEKKDYDFVISYVGVFDRDRGLENLLECVSKHPKVLLNIAGFGVLDEYVKKYASSYRNICCWGRVEYSVGQAIMKKSDLMAAMYHLSSPLHKFAAPNKYYESLVLEVPMITTENTLVGSKVERYNTGFVLDETGEALSKLLSEKYLKEQIEMKKQNCKKTWEAIYSTYYEDFMKNQYMKMIK